MCQNYVNWQFSDRILLRMFPENVSWCLKKSVIKLSLGILMTDFWQFSKSHHDSFLTHFLLLIHIWDIYKTFLTELWQIFESDTFLTDIWHNSDGFLTDFWNWQFSDRYQTDIWHIFETFGTYIDEEYRFFCPRGN